MLTGGAMLTLFLRAFNNGICNLNGLILFVILDARYQCAMVYFYLKFLELKVVKHEEKSHPAYYIYRFGLNHLFIKLKSGQS